MHERKNKLKITIKRVEKGVKLNKGKLLIKWKY